MAMTTLTSISGFSQPLSLETTNNNMRDVSFSSYLSNAEETFVRKLAESSRDLSPKFSVQAEDLHLGRKKAEDSEIGVFSAEKYFKGGLDETNTGATFIVARKYQHNQQREHDDILVVPMKTRPVNSGTPSVRSESSWNSQSALLQSALRIPSRRKTNKAHGKNFLAGLGCKCACSDKDSVDVDEHVDVGEISFKKNPNIAGVVQGHSATREHIRTSPLDVEEHKPYPASWSKPEKLYQSSAKLGIRLNKENCFTFPTLNSVTGNGPIKMQLQETEKARKSLEVFGRPIQDRRNSSERLDKRLTMMSWDATPRMDEIHFPAPSGRIHDDNDSDASSDLFEIESLTGKVAPFLTRQGSDANSGCVTPTTCYAPSEASIEWSVVTASAADFSVMSDYEELRPTSIPSPIKKFPATSPKTRTGKEMSKRRPGILGCKSHKAVNVAGDAYRTNDKAKSDSRMRRVSDSYMPITRIPDEATLTRFNSIPGRHTLATRSLPRPYTPRSSHLLYIQ